MRTPPLKDQGPPVNISMASYFDWNLKRKKPFAMNVTLGTWGRFQMHPNKGPRRCNGGGLWRNFPIRQACHCCRDCSRVFSSKITLSLYLLEIFDRIEAPNADVCGISCCRFEQICPRLFSGCRFVSSFLLRWAVYPEE